MQKGKILFTALLLSLLWCGTESSAAEFTAEQVSSRYKHTEIIDEQKNLWVFGRNKSGQLGNGTYSDVDDAVMIEPSIKFNQVATGEEHTAAITESGRLLTWGSNRVGQLGDPFSEGRSVPAPVYIDEKRIGYDPFFVYVAAGFNYTFAIDSRGTTWAFGQNNCGQLGVGDLNDRRALTRVPVSVTLKKISCGKSHNIGMTAAGNTFVWGSNECGQLGDHTTMTRLTPTMVLHQDAAVDVAAGVRHTVIVTKSGMALTFGCGLYGAIGRNIGECVNTERSRIANYPGTTFKYAAAGNDYSVLVDNCGNLYAAGLGLQGQLGTGSVESEFVFRQLDTDVKFAEGVAGDTHCVFMGRECNLWSWGTGDNGQLGNNVRKSLNPILCVKCPVAENATSVKKETAVSRKKKSIIVSGVKYTEVAGGVQVIGVNKRKHKININKAVSLNGKKYNVIGIAKRSFDDCSKIRKIIINTKEAIKVEKGTFMKIPKHCRIVVKTEKMKKVVLSSGIIRKKQVVKI